MLDAFMGSGTTIMAGEKVGRRVQGLECDPAYVDVAIRRWQGFTGQEAVLEETGQTFAEVLAERDEVAAAGEGAFGSCDGDAEAEDPTEANDWVRLCRPSGEA